MIMRFFWEPLTLFARHRILLRRLTRREFEARYRGSILGLTWAVITPVTMMAVYTFVFHSVLAARWPGHAVDDRMGYALNLLAGLIVFNVIAECLGRAPRLILENPSYVKKLVFPVEILPVVALLGALISASIGCLVLLLLQWATGGPPSPAILLLPLLVMPLLSLCLGVTYLLAALGVFLRDIGQIIGPLVMVLMFLSPVFYPAESVPQPWRDWLELNPLAAAIGWVRGVILLGNLPSVGAYVGQLAAGVLFLALGYRTFMALRPGFADVV